MSDTPAAALRLHGHLTDLAGGLQVRRLLPAAQRRAVGPFVFFDHFGPTTLAPEVDSDVGPHPHIGLATVTYLFEGRQMHRDSLGTVQRIEPGAINWMCAGHGIVHSERSVPEDIGQPRRTHGLQLWVALPPAHEADAPSFQHAAADTLPSVTLEGGLQARVLVGEAFGVASPVRTASPTLYLDLQLPPLARWALPSLAPEMALYVPDEAEGQALLLDGTALPAREMAVLPDGQGAVLEAGPAGARLVLIGGAALPQPVRMWWNFVGSTREVLAEAAQRWAEDRFPTIPGEHGRIEGPAWRG